jgi:hypothetical protein
MNRIALATAVAVLTVAAPLAIGRAAPPSPSYLAPGAAPPWANSTTAMPDKSVKTDNSTSEATATTSATTPAPVSDATSVPVSSAEPQQLLELGTTTPVRAVSLRSGPGSDAPVIGTLHPGEQLKILARAGYGWTQVQSSTATGWAYGSYLASGMGSVAGASGNVVPTSAATPASNSVPATDGVIRR